MFCMQMDESLSFSRVTAVAGHLQMIRGRPIVPDDESKRKLSTDRNQTPMIIGRVGYVTSRAYTLGNLDSCLH